MIIVTTNHECHEQVFGRLILITGYFLRAGRELPGSTGQLIPSTQVCTKVQIHRKYKQYSIYKSKDKEQARIVSTETGEDVPLGEAGELLVKGPQVTLLVFVFACLCLCLCYCLFSCFVA